MATHAEPSLPEEGGSYGSSVTASMTTVMSSLQHTTTNGVLAVSSSILDITPHLTGAIDVIAVRQPDGSLRSTPVYARFGKFVERWSADKSVKILVNGEELPFTMHLGRTGEAHFLREDGSDGASSDSGSSAPAEGGAARGAAIEHIVAVQETAQALEGLDSAEVEPAEAAAAALQLMARAASEVLQLRAQPPSPVAVTNDAASAQQSELPVSTAAVPERRHSAQRDDQQASAPADVMAPFGQLPAPDAAAFSSGDGDRPCLLPIRTRPAAHHSHSSSDAGTGPNTPDVGTAAVPTPMSAPQQLRRAVSGDSELSGEEPAVGSDAGRDSASPEPEAAQLPVPPLSRSLAELTDAELSLCATAIYYCDSPKEVWAEFLAGRVSWEEYADHAEELLRDPELTIRVGCDIMPWSEAQPYVVALLFFRQSAAGALKPTARIVVERPQTAIAVADEPGDSSDAADSEELANNSAVHQDETSDGEYEDADDTVGPHQTENAEVAAAPFAATYSDDAQDSSPDAAVDPAPTAIINAPAAAGEDDILSDTAAVVATAEQPAVVVAPTPALSPAVPGAWAELGQSSYGGLPAPEGSVLADGGLHPLPDATLSLSGDRLSNDASPEEARDVFEAGLVSERRFVDDGAAILRSADLLCRVGGSIFRWRHAVPALAGRVAFPLMPWRQLFRRGMPVAGPSDTSDSPSASSREGPPVRSWGSWLPPWRSPPLQEGDSTRPSSDRGTAGAVPDTVPATQRPRRMRRSFVPTTEELATMPLHDGQNDICFRVGRERQRAFVHVIPWSARLVVSDVDGTITRSDVLGHIMPMVSGHHWSHIGITRLYNDIKVNGYYFVFLSSRSIGQASATRNYLHRLNVDGHQLPVGPVIISPDGLVPSAWREMVVKKPHEFKIRCLTDIRALFPQNRNPFYAGFGNRHTDERSYRAVEIPDVRIFTINTRGELRRSLHAAAPMSLASITELTPFVFPPYMPLQDPDAAEYDEQFSDASFWRQPPRLVDL